MLRRPLERRSAPWIRPGTPLRLLRLRHDFPASRIRLPLPNTNSHETRRNQNRQTRKTNDPNRNLLRSLHFACSNSHRLFILRTVLFRLLDAHLDKGYVQKTHRIRNTLSQTKRTR